MNSNATTKTMKRNTGSLESSSSSVAAVTAQLESTSLQEAQPSSVVSLVVEEEEEMKPIWLTAKPHPFGGAVLAPKHARELTPSLALAMAHTLGEYVMNNNTTTTATTTDDSSSHQSTKMVVQYTEWITEAWSVLGWAEPSASLFWEMATMYHTLHVAGRELSSSPIPPQLSISPSSHTNNHNNNNNNSHSLFANPVLSPSSSTSQHSPSISHHHHHPIPPILSCGSSHSIESANNRRPKSPSEHIKSVHHSSTNNNNNNNNKNNNNTASAKALPVWLLGMFLLLHCEEQAFLRNISGEDGRRFDATGTASTTNHTATGDEYPRSSSSISPRTRIHAGEYTDHYHCVAFLLRHLRKFLLLTAVPHNAMAHDAIYFLAKSENEYSQRNKHSHHHPSYEDDYHDHHTNNEHTKLNAQEILYRHEADHHQVGLTVQLTTDDLERLNFLLQPPSGGLMDNPPIRISDTLLIRNQDGLILLEQACRTSGAVGL